jgi:DNA alkylation repair enzyme
MTAVPNVLRRLKRKARAANLRGMAKFGITIDGRQGVCPSNLLRGTLRSPEPPGVSVPDMRRIAREIGQDHGLALDLWKTEIAEARQVAAMIDDPRKVTEKQMEIWVADFDSWDLCDGVCLNLFEKTPFVRRKIREWATRDEEFVKRAAFALIACLAWHDKTATDGNVSRILPPARARRERRAEFRWIAADAIRELESEAVRERLRSRTRRNPRNPR